MKTKKQKTDNSGRNRVRANKNLGQHFLRSKTVVAKIVEAANIQPSDCVLEIGPGEGVLTNELLDAGAHVLAVETDMRLIHPLTIRFEDADEDGRLEIIHGDILDKRVQDELFATDLANDRPYKLVANIPYYITGALFRLFLEKLRQPTDIIFLVQKEVAEQVTARNGKENIFSLAVKAFGNPTYVAKVPRKAFRPAPKVDSAIIRIENISRERVRGIEEKYFNIIKTGLGSRRKMLLGNLTRKLRMPREHLEQKFHELSLPIDVRGEDVPFDKWVALAKLIA